MLRYDAAPVGLTARKGVIEATGPVPTGQSNRCRRIVCKICFRRVRWRWSVPALGRGLSGGPFSQYSQGEIKGEFGLVNTHYPEIDGLATVNSLGKLPFVPELVVITAPAAAVVGIIDEAGKRGASGALILARALVMGRVRWPMLPNASRRNMECG